MTRDIVTAFLGLGGNVGDVLANMRSALQFLDANEQIDVGAVSAVYKTPPWGIEEQDWFLNACACVKTGLDAAGLLEQCLAAERSLNRIRDVRWGPRTIDLDVLVFGDQQINMPNLVVPHPRMQERAFVLKPLEDIAPDMEISGKTPAGWLAELNDGSIQPLGLEKDWWH